MAGRLLLARALVSAILLIGVARAAPSAQQVNPQASAPRIFWSGSEGHVDARLCPNQPDAYCLVWSRADGRVLTTAVDTLPANVSLMWRRDELDAPTDDATPDEPDFLFYADGGGSGLCGLYVALDVAHEPHFHSFEDCHQITRAHDAATRTGAFGFIADFPVEAPFGAADSESVSASYPLLWKNGTFALDVRHLVPSRPQANAPAIVHAETASLIRSGAVAGTGLPHTTQILLDLIFAGHADKAHALLIANAAPDFRAELYWRDLCAILVADPNWKSLMHDVLPASAEIEHDARSGQRFRTPSAYGRLPAPSRSL